MIDIVGELNAIRRETKHRPVPAGDSRTVAVRRGYDAPIAEVWDAITNSERISRWFLPVTGDLRLGGKYQLEGNAGGEILRCEPPRLLRVTWVFGDNTTGDDTGDSATGAGVSEVEVRLSSHGDGTLFELEHTAVVEPERWIEFGPGAVGVGWDLTLLGLSLYLRGGPIEDPDAWSRSPAAGDFMTGSSRAWGAANEAAGATSAEAATATENTTRFYVPI